MRRVPKVIAFLLWSIPFFVLALVVFFLTARMALTLRLVIALTIWLLPTAVLTLWVLHIGDKPLPGAITIDPKALAPDKNDPKESGEPK